jgi:16S rRNA (uracil1498-N3)-methyltransferase
MNIPAPAMTKTAVPETDTRDARRIRIYVEHGLGPGLTFPLSDSQAHYLRDVMRCAGGESVRLFNGRDGEWRARLRGVGKRGAAAEVEERIREQSASPDLWLLFAPVKGGRVEDIVEKATELGVARLRPVVTARTVVPKVNTRRLRARAVEAAEQCGRLDVPTIDEAEPLETVLRDWPTRRRLVWCDESGGGAPIATALRATGAAAWAVMTGPEGGYAPAELDALRGLPFVTPVSLGGRILRADTAAIAALACLQAVAGDWGAVPPPSCAR